VSPETVEKAVLSTIPAMMPEVSVSWQRERVTMKVREATRPDLKILRILAV